MMKKLLCLAALLLGSASASAQTMMDLSSINLGVRQLRQKIFLSHSVKRSIARSAVRREVGQKAGPANGGTSTGRQPAAPQAGGTTTFNSVAPSLMPQELASQMAKTPAERARLERTFSQLLENYRNNLRRSNAPPNDVARAASYLIAASYMVYNDAGPLSDAQYAALREQMRKTFATDAEFQRLSDRERQQLFEGYGIVGAWIDVGFNLVREAGDRKAEAQWRQMARTNLENMLGAPADKISFTDDGVQFR